DLFSCIGDRSPFVGQGPAPYYSCISLWRCAMVVEQTDSNNMATSLDAAPQATAKASWLALFRDGNAFISIMLTGGVAIHALSLRVISTVLPSVVEEIDGLRFFTWSTTVAIVSAIWGAAFAASWVRWRGL